MSVSITTEDVDAFHEQGYLVLEEVFDTKEVERMRGEADRILELVVNSSLANDRQSGRLDLVKDDGGERMVRKVQPVNDLSLALAEASDDDRFLDPMREVMDDEPVLMEEKLNYKEPLPERIEGLDPNSPTSGFPVHNDWAYYKQQGYPQSIVSSAICLDDCTAENGPIHVWPGSHTEHLEHESMANGLEVPPDAIDHDGREDVLAPAGSVLLFHTLLVHNSKPNESGEPRRLMIYSHYPETAMEMGFDGRNGPARFHESPWEWEYQRKKAAGEFTDRFEAPTF